MSSWGRLISKITRWPTGARLAILAASVYLGFWSEANSTVKMIAISMSCFVGTLIAYQLLTRLILSIKRVARAVLDNRPEKRFSSLMRELDAHREWHSGRSSWFGGVDPMTRWNTLSAIATELSELGVSHPPVTYSTRWSGDFDFRHWDRFLETLRVCTVNGALKAAIKEAEQFLADMQKQEEEREAAMKQGQAERESETRRMVEVAKKREVERVRRARAAAGGLKG